MSEPNEVEVPVEPPRKGKPLGHPGAEPPPRRRGAKRHSARAMQTYRAFLKRLCANGRMGEDFAERALVSVLCHLEQRLLADEARQMEAQLPQKLQSLLYVCSRSPSGPAERFTRDEYLERVGVELGMPGSEVEGVVRSVLVTVADTISEGEIEDVLRELPSEFHDLFRRGA